MNIGMRMLKKWPHESIKIELLKAGGATTFSGATDPVDAKVWMDILEKCLDEMGCSTDENKVSLATFLLQDGAKDWWKSVKSKQLESKVTSWSEFKIAFYEEYYPQSYRDAKQSEFLKLVQGSMTVAEYEKMYIELSKHAVIKDEIDKCTRFENGLREDIRTSIHAVQWKKFKKLVRAASEVERSTLQKKSEKEPSKNVPDDSIRTITISNGSSKPKLFGIPSSSTRMKDTGSPVLMVGFTSLGGPKSKHGGTPRTR